MKKLGPREALVDVLGEAIDVPRPLLDIVSAPPQGITEYAVCPNCRERVPLTVRPPAMRCRHCNEMFDVAWEEKYFQGA